MTVYEFAQSLGEYRNGRKGFRKVSRGQVREFLVARPSATCRFLIWRDRDRAADGSGLLLCRSLEDTKAGVLARSGLLQRPKEKAKGKVSRSCWYSCLRHDHRDVQVAARKVDVCPVEPRYDNWLIPRATEPL